MRQNMLFDAAFFCRRALGEYLCPLCKFLGNVLVPIFSELETKHSRGDVLMDLERWFTEPASFLSPRDQCQASAIRFATEISLLSRRIGTDTSSQAADQLIQLYCHTIATMEISVRRSVTFDNSGIQALGKRRIRTLKHLGSAVRSAVQGQDSVSKVQLESWDLLRSSFGPSSGESILDFETDPFQLLVRCWVSLPQAHAYQIQAVLRCCYGLALLQAAVHILTQQIDPAHQYARFDESKIQVDPQPELWALFKALLHHSPAASVSVMDSGCCSPEDLDRLVLTFLRKSSIFLHTSGFCDIPDEGNPSVSPFRDEVVSLTSVLNLPTPEAFFLRDQELWVRFISRCQQVKFLTSPIMDFCLPPSLVQLPNDFDRIFQQEVVCSQCQKFPTHPAVCLVCGQLLCATTSCCAKNGKMELSAHTEECCSGNGIFLFVKESTVYLLAEGLVLPYGSPYVDRHGEQDLQLVRGLPLHLHADRWNQLVRLFDSQLITSIVYRQHPTELSYTRYGI